MPVLAALLVPVAEEIWSNGPTASKPRYSATTAAARSEAVKPRKPGLSQKEQRRLDEVERTLAELAERLAKLDRVLADPAAFLRPESPGHTALRTRETLLSESGDLELEWLELEGKRAET